MTPIGDTGIAGRCAALRQPVSDLLTTGIRAVTSPAVAGEFIARIRDVQNVLAGGVEGIDDPAYLSWHPLGVQTVADMLRAMERSDAAEAWRLLTDPVTGFFPLGQSCKAQPGW